MSSDTYTIDRAYLNGTYELSDVMEASRSSVGKPSVDRDCYSQ